MGCFTSTRSNAIKEFDSYFDSEVRILSLDKSSIAGLSELLGGKYYVTGTVEVDKEALQEFEMYGYTNYVYEQDACPIGFAVSNFISEQELRSISLEDRGIALLAAALVPDEEMESVSDILTEATADTIDFGESVADYVADNSARAVHDFTRDSNGFTCTTAYDEDSYVYFSVPYDNDWTLKIDGEAAEIISSGGMMLVRVSAGEHSLVFTYATPYYRQGVAMALMALVVLAGYEVVLYKKKKPQRG